MIKPASDAELREIAEAIAEGAGIEIIPHENGGWYARIGVMRNCIVARTRAELFLKVAELFLEPEPVGQQ